MQTTKWSQLKIEKNISENYPARSLDSLANSSNPSESISDDSHDSDSGADTKNSFSVKCEVYQQQNGKNYQKPEKIYGYASSNKSEENRSEPNSGRMETIPEEIETKVSVKAILARFENLNGKSDKDYVSVIASANKIKEASSGSESVSGSSVQSSINSNVNNSTDKAPNVHSDDSSDVVDENKQVRIIIFE